VFDMMFIINETG